MIKNVGIVPILGRIRIRFSTSRDRLSVFQLVYFRVLFSVFQGGATFTSIFQEWLQSLRIINRTCPSFRYFRISSFVLSTLLREVLTQCVPSRSRPFLNLCNNFPRKALEPRKYVAFTGARLSFGSVRILYDPLKIVN